MSKQVIKLISPFCGLLPVERLPKIGSSGFIFPFWHAVSDNSRAHLSKLYQVPKVAAFERDLDFLLKHFKPATVGNIFDFTEHREISGPKLFFPSFDDGLSECHQFIAPILKRKGIQAAFFINPAFVDNKMLFHRHQASLILNVLANEKAKQTQLAEVEKLVKQTCPGKTVGQFLRQAKFADLDLLREISTILGIDIAQYLLAEQPYMTLDQIKKLQEDGFIIGAHGIDHREFAISSETEMYNQIAASIDFLIEQVNPEVKMFAFPFTDFKVPDAVFEKANQSGVWDLSFGTAGIKDEKMNKHIQRIPMESEKSVEGKQIIRSEFVWYLVKSLFGKNKVSRQ